MSRREDTVSGNYLDVKTDPPRDHVDRVREQWRAARPELDTAPLEIVARVGRIAALFDASTNALMGRFGLARGSWDVLASLRRTEAPHELSPTDLYRGLMRTSSAMTNRLNRLERERLIERTPDASDGRSMRVRLTARGRALVDEIAPLHLANERSLLASLTAEEQDTLAGLLRSLAVGLERG
jgi:DNA-binding MarR family transcriptional regulator